MKIQPADYYKDKEIKSESPRNMGYPDHPRGQAQKKTQPNPASKTHNREIPPEGVAGSTFRGVSYHSLKCVHYLIRHYPSAPHNSLTVSYIQRVSGRHRNLFFIIVIVVPDMVH